MAFLLDGVLWTFLKSGEKGSLDKNVLTGGEERQMIGADIMEVDKISSVFKSIHSLSCCYLGIVKILSAFIQPHVVQP